MKPTILLVGRTGQIGSHLHRLLPNLGTVVAPDRGELDVSDGDAIRRTIRYLNPQIIVNAAAYTAVDAAESDEAAAFSINAEAPAVLAQEAKRLGAMLVHYSTDYVFDGLKRTPYSELDPTNPINIYGKTKFAGEEAVRNSGASHLIFRTAWVYATTGRNFLLTILRLATERQELKIVRDQVGAPTRARDIAEATTKILARLDDPTSEAGSAGEASGIYHMTASGETTWFDFARTILEKASSTSFDLPWLLAATRGRPLLAERIVPVSTEEFRSPTRRPAYSVLSNSRLSQTFKLALPDWRTQLSSCFTPETATGTSVARISATRA
jgi:dTDP-4-dehydrorhamnose reductase